jgi:hypothetical protein
MKRIILFPIILMLFVCSNLFAEVPFVDTGFDGGAMTDVDLVVARENYNSETFQQGLYFHGRSNVTTIANLGGTIFFPSYISIVSIRSGGNEAFWQIPDAPYNGSLGPEDYANVNGNSIDFYMDFNRSDAFSVIIDYGDSFPDNSSFDIILDTGISEFRGIEFDKGIQVGDITSSVFGAGDYGEVTSLSVPLTVIPEPISSILFIVGGATLGFRRFWIKRRTA